MSTLNEDGRATLRKIVEAQAYRQLMAMNIRGHCLKFFTDLEAKVTVAEELHRNLTLLREVRTLYRELGWEGVESAVRDRMARIPYPESRLEFAMFRLVCGLALEKGMESYEHSSHAPLAAIARSFLDTRPTNLDDPELREFCADPSNRPHAQQMFDRWFAIAVRSLGRPGTAGDKRAFDLRLRTRPASDVLQSYLDAIRATATGLDLRLPDPEDHGLSLPEPNRTKTAR